MRPPSRRAQSLSRSTPSAPQRSGSAFAVCTVTTTSLCLGNIDIDQAVVSASAAMSAAAKAMSGRTSMNSNSGSHQPRRIHFGALRAGKSVKRFTQRAAIIASRPAAGHLNGRAVGPTNARRRVFRPVPMRSAPRPLPLVADLIRCSRQNGLILDPLGRSGTTILAAEKTGRVARVIESDPRYADMAIRRWERMTGVRAHHAETKLSFADTETGLLSKAPAGPAALMQRPLRRLP